MAAATQHRRLLLEALATIPLDRRAVLIMHEVDETPMRDIAEQLSIPLFTAYSRLRKARRELETALVALLKGGDHAQ
jgi:RNA polymerase sigma-70 factor (ECF subfamily)